MNVAVKQQPETLLPELGFNLVETSILSNTMQIQHPAELQALNLYYPRSVCTSDLEESNVKQVGRCKLLEADLIKVSGPAKREQYSIRMVNKSLTRLKWERGSVVAVRGEFAGHGAYNGGAHTDNQAEEVRIDVVLVC